MVTNKTYLSNAYQMKMTLFLIHNVRHTEFSELGMPNWHVCWSNWMQDWIGMLNWACWFGHTGSPYYRNTWQGISMSNQYLKSVSPMVQHWIITLITRNWHWSSLIWYLALLVTTLVSHRYQVSKLIQIRTRPDLINN